METRASTIPLVQNNNEVMQLQNYSFRKINSFWPSAVSKRASRIAPWSAGNEWIERKWLSEIFSNWTCKWRVLDGKLSPRRQRRESFYFSRCGVCLRPVFGGSEVNETAVEKERNKHGRCPSSPCRGGVLEVLQADGLVKGLFFLWEFVLALNKKLRPLMTCRRSLVWWAWILIAKCCCDSTRREAAGMGATQRKQMSKMASGSHQLLKFMAALSR